MQAVRAEFPLDAALDHGAAWRRMRDLTMAHMYVPGLAPATFVGPQREGPGTHRRVRLYGLLAMDETVTAWREGQGFTLRLHRGAGGPLPPLREHYFDYRLDVRDGRVWLANSMRYAVGLGALGALLERLLLRPIFRRQLHDITLAQKLYYETGKRATPAMLKAARATLAAQV